MLVVYCPEYRCFRLLSFTNVVANFPADHCKRASALRASFNPSLGRRPQHDIATTKQNTVLKFTCGVFSLSTNLPFLSVAPLRVSSNKPSLFDVAANRQRNLVQLPHRVRIYLLKQKRSN
jgi:hypothetical protein